MAIFFKKKKKKKIKKLKKNLKYKNQKYIYKLFIIN